MHFINFPSDCVWLLVIYPLATNPHIKNINISGTLNFRALYYDKPATFYKNRHSLLYKSGFFHLVLYKR